jgi:2-keto-3-deoxy-L-rhamnonate aldolase RhmA
MTGTEARRALKARLRGRQRLFAAWTSFGHPGIAEIFSMGPFDFVGIDLEHSTINQSESQRIIAATQAEGVCCLPRVATHDAEMIKRCLDSGADGIIAPMVSSAAEAERLAGLVKYSPAGNRSFGVARAQRYGAAFEEYVTDWNDSSIFVPQIESVEAVESISTILDNEHVDAVMIGPYDLSGSLGVPGQLHHPTVKQAIDTVVEACQRHKKGCGTQLVEPDRATVEDAFAAGFSFVVLASDVFLLWKWVESMGDMIDSCGKAD